MPHWKLTSDGTPSGTHVYYDGNEVRDVQAVRFSVERGDLIGHVEITIGPALIEVDAGMLNTHVIHEQPF